MPKKANITSILRFGKSIKANNQSLLHQMTGHNVHRNWVSAKSGVNEDMRLVAGSGDYVGDMEEYDSIKGIDRDKQRKDATIGREIMLSLSPTILNNSNADRFSNDAKAFVVSMWWDWVSAQLHLDEATPHIHGIISSTNTSKDRWGNSKTSYNIARQTNLRYNKGKQANDIQTAYNDFMKSRGWDIEGVNKKSKSHHVHFNQHHIEVLEAKVKELSTALREKALKYKAVETVVNKIDKGLLIKFLQATGVKVEKKSSNMDLFLSIEQPGGRIKPD